MESPYDIVIVMWNRRAKRLGYHLTSYNPLEVRFIEFEFGLSELSAVARKKLDALAKFLNARPALTLSIEGTVNRHMDQIKLLQKQAEKEKPSSGQATAKAQQKCPAEDQVTDVKQLDQLPVLALMRANEVKQYLI